MLIMVNQWVLTYKHSKNFDGYISFYTTDKDGHVLSDVVLLDEATIITNSIKDKIMSSLLLAAERQGFKDVQFQQVGVARNRFAYRLIKGRGTQ
jgi:hypothetical protein